MWGQLSTDIWNFISVHWTFLAWAPAPSFSSLISYGSFQSHLQFRDIVPMPLWSEALISQDIFFYKRNETILGQPNWQKRVWTCWSTLFVEGPTLTVDHATVDLSIRLHSLGGWGCPISIMCRSLTSSSHCRLIGVRDLPSVLVKYGSLRSPISLSPAIGNSNQLSFNGRRERIARKSSPSLGVWGFPNKG